MLRSKPVGNYSFNIVRNMPHRIITPSIILLTLMLIACSPRMVEVVTASRDSTHSRTERIIDTVRMDNDSSLLAALLECDSLGRVKIARMDAENGRLVAQVMELQENLLLVKAQADIPVRWRETIRADTVTVREEVPIPYEVVRERIEYRLRWWQKWLCWIGLFYVGRTAIKLILGWKSLTLKTLFKIL